MEARSQALSEIFERHIKNRIIREGLCLPEVPDHVIARYPGITAGIKGLRDAGFGILVRDASLGGRYPVMNVTLLHPKDQGCFASFGAHPASKLRLSVRSPSYFRAARWSRSKASRAWIRYGRNHAAFESRNSLCRFERRDPLELSGRHARLPLLRLEFQHHDRGRLCVAVRVREKRGQRYLRGRLFRAGCLQLPHSGAGDVEIYPVEDLEWENNSVGNGVRPALLDLPSLSDDDARELLANLQTLNLNDERPLWEILGLAIPVGTPWKELRVGELKTLLALAIGDDQATREGCDWIRQYQEMNPARRLVYRCIESLLNLEDTDDYRRALNLLYGADTVRQAESLLDRRDRFGLERWAQTWKAARCTRTCLKPTTSFFAGSEFP